MQHFFWRYFDRTDPTYPGDGPYRDIIKEFYRRFDDIIGRLWEQMGRDGTLLVISDHGHGRRSTKALNLNEFLRRRGYLSSRVRRMRLLDHRYLVERLKTKAFQLMYERDLDDLILKMVKYIPKRKTLKDSSFITDREGSLAYVPDFAGRNPFGGVTICRAEVEKRGLSYEDLRDQLIQEISRIRDPQNGEKVVQWITRREEVYAGQHLDKYPDLVFELQKDYGVSWSLHGTSVDVNPTHKKVSGGHRMEGVLMMANAKREVAVEDPGLMDIAPTIMDLLGVRLTGFFHGASILR